MLKWEVVIWQFFPPKNNYKDHWTKIHTKLLCCPLTVWRHLRKSMATMGQILGRRGVHWDEYYRKAIDFPLEHLPIQIVGHRASCGCMELKLDSLCQENRNWSSELPGGPEMGGEYLREREPQQCHPEAKCNKWHEEFNIVFNSKLDTARKRTNKL